MITIRARIYPQLDKVAEARDFMMEWIKQGQANGRKVALAQRIYTSEGPMLMVPRQYADLAAADAQRKENQADAAWMERANTLATLVREPIRQSIEETLVPMATPPQQGVVRRVFFYPALDRVPEYRARLEEFVRAAHAAGRTEVSLAQQIFSETGPLFVGTTTHPDMADLERVRQERMSAAQGLIDSLAGISRAPVAVRLLEVVVPFAR